MTNHIKTFPPSLKREEALLMVVDEQGKLFDQTYEHDTIVKNSKIMIRGAQILKIPILVTEQYPKGLGPTVPEMVETLGEDYKPIEKKTFSCLAEPNIIKAVEKQSRSQLILIGIEAHVCVHQTCIHALQMGLEVFFVNDAISSRSKWNRDSAFSKMQMAGAFPSPAEMTLFELMYTAQIPEFKQISELVR